jgi:hypothetical protein
MLQQNWALIDPNKAGEVRIYFIGDTSRVFDELTFASRADAAEALRGNGFRRYAGSPDLQSFLRPRLRHFTEALIPTVLSIPPAASGGRDREYWRQGL